MKKHGGLAVLAIIVAGLVAVAAFASGGTGARPGGTIDAALSSDEVAPSVERTLGRAPETATKDGLGTQGARNGSGAPAPQGVAPPPTSGGGSGVSASEPSTAASMDSRKIVQTASLKMQVKDVADSFAEIGQIATAANGFVAGSNFVLQGEQQLASVTVRVPATRYQEVLAELRALAHKVDAESSNANDVTEEYTDLMARIRNLEIEQAKGRLMLLDKLSDLATITVALRPVAPAGSGTGVNLGAEVKEAWQESLDFLAGVAGGVVSVLVFSWWAIVLAIPAAIAWQRWLRSRPAAAPAAYD
jgi:hypothetical protein